MKIIVDSLFKYLDKLNDNQSNFRLGDSCVHHLLSIIHDIYEAFDPDLSLEDTGVFLNLSKLLIGFGMKV